MGTRAAAPWPVRWATPGRVLVAGMSLSAIFVFAFGRRASFSGDEFSIVSLVARLEPSELFEPYVGHLVTIPLLVYRATLEVFGPGDYFAFQALTLASIFLLVWFLYLWARERVPPWVAVAPCLLLTIFPQDVLHYLAGNGFVIVFALACGLGALYAFERNSRKWDLVSFGLIILGLMTYTVGAAFAVGVLVAGLLARDRRRVWVAALPLLAYAIWRLTVASSSGEAEDVGPDFLNLLLLPAWTFQSIGGSLAALLGIDFEFAIPAPEARVGEFIVPVLATAFLVLGGIVVGRGRAGSGLVVVAAVALALFASQTVVWGSFEARPGPGEDRYLYPGALVVVLLGLELARTLDWSPFRVKALWLVTIASLSSSIGILAASGNREALANLVRAEVLAVTLLDSTAEPPAVRQQPRDALRRSFDSVDGARFGYLGFTESELAGSAVAWGSTVDAFLAESLDLRLRPVPPGVVPRDCAPAASGVVSIRTRAELPVGGAILYSTRLLRPLLGRYGEGATVRVGNLPALRPALLRVPRDDGQTRWFLTTGRRSSGTMTDLVVCRLGRARSAAIGSGIPEGPAGRADSAIDEAKGRPEGP